MRPARTVSSSPAWGQAAGVARTSAPTQIRFPGGAGRGEGGRKQSFVSAAGFRQNNLLNGRVRKEQNMRKMKWKGNPSWHQKEMRRMAIILIVICLVIFTGLFYWIARRFTLPPN
jgi:hypothetical protein